jgi:transcriptional regulator with XRE-family HTH domain
MSPIQNNEDEGKMLARKLKEAREFLNLSQQFVADETKIPRSAISDIERGTRKVESLELKRLAALYRMSTNYLLGAVYDDETAGSADPTVSALARAATSMTNSEKQEVLRFALFLRNYQAPGENP